MTPKTITAPRQTAAPLAGTARETVAILGLGYVGLPTALAFAAGGVRVIGVDVAERRLEDIAAGAVDLVAEDHARLRRHRGGELRCTADVAQIAAADAVVVCVPTPVDAAHRPDLRALRAACATVVAHARPGQLLVLTSTTSVGSTRELLTEPLARRGLTAGTDVFVAFAPERIDPGNTTHPQALVPRVVGGVTAACAERAERTLGTIAPVHRVSSPEAAELCKLHENTYRAVNIAYSYEIARAAATYGLDPVEVIDAAATKPFGFMPFYPGAGVGGHCIPCDPHYLLAPLAAQGVASPIVHAAMDAIATRPGAVVARAAELLGGDVRGARVLVVGAAYKPGVADHRESPAVAIIEDLLRRGADVRYHDPLIPTLEVDGRLLVSAPGPEAEDADLVVLACVHPGTTPAWEDADATVLDCTYRARGTTVVL